MLRRIFFVSLFYFSSQQLNSQCVVNIGPDVYLCNSGSSTTINENHSGCGGNFNIQSWKINNNIVATSGNSLDVNYSLISPIQTVVCNAGGNNGNGTDTAIVYSLNISGGTIGTSSYVCNGSDPPSFVSNNAGSTNIGDITYQWQSSPNGTNNWTNINGATNATYDPPPTNVIVYYRRCLIVSINGTAVPTTCYEYSNELSTTPLPQPSINPSNQCVNSGSNANPISVSFSPNLPFDVTASYTWTGPNSFTSSNSSITISNVTSAKAGQYFVTVTLTSGGSQICNFVLNSTINLIPPAPTFNFPSSGCPGTAYSPSSLNVQANTTYSWSFSPSSGATGTGLNTSTPSFTFSNSGNYTICATATFNGCTSTQTCKTISIANLSNVPPSILVNGTYYNATSQNGINTIAICAGLNTSSIIIENNNSSPPNPVGTSYSYSLNNGPNTPITFQSSAVINYGNNTLTLIATSGSCSLPLTTQIYSGSNPYVSIGGQNSVGLCPGDAVLFSVDPTPSSGITNPPGTLYTLSYSDVSGTTPLINLVGDTIVSHTYNLTSCGASGNIFTATVTAQNPCGQTINTYSPITVNNFPNANFTVSDTTLCAGQTTIVTNTGSQGSIVGQSSPYNCNTQGKFYWTITGGVLGTNYTLGAGQVLGSFNTNYGSTTSNGSNTLNVTYLTAGYYTITQTYYNSCGSKSKVRNVCVINPPTCGFTTTPPNGCTPLSINLTNTTVVPSCSSTPVPLTYSWTISAPPTGVTASFSASTAQNPTLSLTNSTTAPVTLTVTLTVTPKDPYNTSQPFGNTTSNCISSCTQTVTVYPKPTFTPVNLTTCSSPYTTNINLQTSTNMTSTFSWSAVDNTNVSGESLTTQTTSLINNTLTATSPQTVVYNVIPSSSFGCIGNASTTTVNLNIVQAGSISSDQTICYGGNPAQIIGTTANGIGTVSYQWQQSTDNINWTNIGTASSTALTYDPPGPNNVTTYYRRVVTYLSNGISCTSTSNVVTVTVNSINPGAISSSQTICTGADGAPISVSTSSTGLGVLTYQWQSSTTSATTNFTNITGQTGTSYDPPTLATTTWYQYVTTSVLNGVSCSSSTPVVSITVINLNVGSITASQTICSGGDPVLLNANPVATTNGTSLTYQWQLSLDNITWTNITGEINATFNPPILTTTTYYRRITNAMSGSSIICSNFTNTVTITVIPDPVITTQPLASQTICAGGTVSPPLNISFSGGSGTVSYQWATVSSTGVYTPITSANGGTAATYSPTLNTAGTYNYAVNITQSVSGCSTGYSQNAQVIVSPDPTVSISPSTATSYCQNSGNIQTLTASATGGFTGGTYSYQWWASATNSNSAGSAISGATLNTFTPPVTNTGTTYYYVVITQPPTIGCNVSSSTVQIVVNSGATITTQPTASQTVCLGGTLTALSVAYSGSTGTPSYQWYSNTTNSTSGGTAILNATSASYPPPNNSASTTYYYCVISFSGSAGCSSVTSNVAAVNILADPIITTQPLASQTICAGGTVSPPLNISFSGGSGTISYQWATVSSTGIYTPITSANGGTAATYSPTLNTAGTYNYAINITQSVSGCSTGYSQNAQVIVVADPTIVISPSTNTYCQNSGTVSPITSTVNGGTSSGNNYQWYSNTLNSNMGGTLLIGATQNSYTPSISNIGNQYFYCVVSQASGCSAPSNISTISVVSGPTLTTQPTASQTVCVGGTLTALNVTYSGSTGTPSYQWYSNTTNSTTGGTAILNATSAIYPPPNNSASTTYYYCVISFSGSAGCSSVTSNVAAVNILADPIITTQPLASQTICAGGTVSPPLSVSFSGGSGTVSYQWATVSSTGVYTPITSANGGSAATYSPTLSTTGTFNYAVNITQSISGCSTGYSQNAQVIVIADPTIVISPSTATYCQNSGTVSPINSTVNGGTSSGNNYQWYSNTSNSNVGGTIINGATNSSYTPPVTATGNQYYYCVVTQAAGCSTSSNVSTITVITNPTISSQPTALQTICVGGTVSALTVTLNGGVGTPTYQWYSNNVNASFGGNLILGQITNTYQPPNNTTGTYYYYCVITYSSNSCSLLTSNVSQVVINNDPIITNQPLASQSICFNSSINQPLSVSYSGGLGNVTYQWNTIANSVSNPISGQTNSTFNPGVYTISDTFYYNVQVNFSGNGCNSITSNLAQIIVAPIPLVDSIPSYIYCNADSTTLISFTSPIPSTSYVWNNSDTTTGLGLTGTGDIQPFSAYNMGSFTLVSTVNVTPILSLPDTTCIGPIESFTITVNPFQNVNDPLDTIVCHGTGLPGYFFTGTSTVYNWTNDNTSIGLGFSGSGNIPAFFASNTTTQPVIANLSVTPDFNGVTTCPGDIELFTITILPIPTISNLSNQIECNGNTTSPYIFTGNATSYTWTNDNSAIGLASSGTGNINAFTATANSIASVGNISVTPIYAFNNLSCSGNLQNFSITVLPTPTVFPTNDTIVCEGDLITFNIFNGNANYFQWYNNNTSIGSDTIGIDLINPFLSIDTAITPVSSTFFVIPINSLNGTICPGPTDDFTITVIPAADLLPISDQSVCGQTSTSPVIFTGNATNYYWSNQDPSIGLSNSGNGNIGSFIGINNSATPNTSSIFVYPQYIFNNVTCQNDPIEFQITVIPSPSVNLIQDQVICHNSPSNAVNFVGNYENIQWFNDNPTIGLGNSGNGNISTFVGVNNSMNPAVSNIYYQPSISYLNEICYGIIDTFSITVLSIPTLNQVTNQTICVGEPTQPLYFSGISTDYEWSNNNVNIGLGQSGVTNIPSFIPTNTTNSPLIGNIMITPVNSSNGTSCYGESQNISFTVYPTPKLLNEDLEICSGNNTNITLQSSIPSNFEWYGLINPNISGETFTANYNASINDILLNNSIQIDTILYIVNLTGLYCENTDTILVEVINFPEVDFSISTTVLCSGNIISFQNNSDPSVDYTWDFGDGNSSSEYSPSYIYENSGNYTVTLSGSVNNSICSNSDVMNISVMKSPNAEFVASDTTGCGNVDATFTLLQNDPFTSMVWSFGNGSFSEQIGSATHQFTEEGCYDISVVVTNNVGCVSLVTYDDLICVYDNPVAIFDVDKNVVNVFSSEVTFTNQSLNANSIMWDFADGNVSFADNLTYSFTEFGDYNVVLTAYNEIGCIDTASINIHVQEDEIVFTPNTFTPNGDEGNQVFLPIIAQGYKKNVYELTIYNRWGEIVFSTKDPSEGWNGKFNNYTDCQDGVYIWKLTLQPIQSFENQIFYGHVNLIR